MIYLDSSAIVKLMRPEPETAQLHAWLVGQADVDLVSSTLAEVEVQRALRRVDPGRLVAVPTILAKISQIEIDRPVRATAAAYPDPNLRSLDAIHLATAHSLVLEGIHLTALVTYDQRMFAAASAIGLPAVSPGRAA